MEWPRAGRWGDEYYYGLDVTGDEIDVDDSDGWWEADWESGIELQPGGAAFVDVVVDGEFPEGTLHVRTWGAFNDVDATHPWLWPYGDWPPPDTADHRVGRVILHPPAAGGRVCVRDGSVQVDNINESTGWERSVILDDDCPKATVVWVNTDLTRRIGSIVEEGKLSWTCHWEIGACLPYPT